MSLAQRFYSDLWQWGAPETAVISGALLYMNDAVVLNAPPFSNFSNTVMWIDDHLRYVLHREMGDFCKDTHVDPSTQENLHVFYDKIKVSKYRTNENFVLYTLEKYLPTLLWGSFVDYWLCPQPILKLRKSSVKAEDRGTWEQGRMNGCPGILSRAVSEARAGYRPDEAKLREELVAGANKRLKSVRYFWRSLTDNYRHSFASAWVEGALPESLKSQLGDNKKIPDKLPERIDEFTLGLKDEFNQLLDDTCQYVKWVYEWPRVVSVIRSVPNGEFRSDLDWTNKPAPQGNRIKKKRSIFTRGWISRMIPDCELCD